MKWLTWFRKKKGSELRSKPKSPRQEAAVAKSVLTFISLGLTNGAQTIAETYHPSDKVNEFVAVSEKLLHAFENGFGKNFSDNSIALTASRIFLGGSP